MNILYFAWMREHTGCAAEEIDLPDGVSTLPILCRIWLAGQTGMQQRCGI